MTTTQHSIDALLAEFPQHIQDAALQFGFDYLTFGDEDDEERVSTWAESLTLSDRKWDRKVYLWEGVENFSRADFEDLVVSTAVAVARLAVSLGAK
jgi:hypothetical protein